MRAVSSENRDFKKWKVWGVENRWEGLWAIPLYKSVQAGRKDMHMDNYHGATAFVLIVAIGYKK